MNDDVYNYDFEVLVQALYVAAKDDFKDEIVGTDMLQYELEDNPGMSEEEYTQDWIYQRVSEWIMRGLELDE